MFFRYILLYKYVSHNTFLAVTMKQVVVLEKILNQSRLKLDKVRQSGNRWILSDEPTGDSSFMHALPATGFFGWSFHYVCVLGVTSDFNPEYLKVR